MSETKTMGQVLTEAQYKRAGWVLPKEPGRLFELNENIAAAVIEAHEAAKWRPMSDAPRDGSALILIDESDLVYAGACPSQRMFVADPIIVNGRRRWETGDVDYGDERVLAWQLLPDPPEVPR